MLGLLTALGPFTIDLYLPALPAIAHQLHTSESAVQLTLTGTLAGLGVGQLVAGPLSDALGRRRPLLAGIGLHIVASLLCAVSSGVALLGTLRFLEGLGAAGAAVIAMAVVRDRFAGDAAATVLSRLILVVGASPVLAPTVGAQLLRWTDWRGTFVALAVIGAGTALFAGFALPETLPPERRRSGGVRTTVADYRRLLRDRVFVGLVLVTGLSMAGLFAYVAGSSFVLQEQFGLTKQQFGIVFAVNAIALIGAPQLNVVLLKRFTPYRILRAALVGGAVLAVLLMIVTLTGVGDLPAILLLLFPALAAVGFRGPNATALALSRHGEAAGTAASLLGAFQFGVGGLAAPLVGVLGNDAVAMVAVITMAAFGALVVLLALVRPDRVGDVPAHDSPVPELG
ncbi:multidrug effflux MFS transporter [Actinoplanes sp. CA-030573]|uniref:multidrug effflux MFS transporter n=1 Tax=Actinoplanes sp. CA-030573 TaxID=3239898 RepID=UPI003D8ED595